MWPRHSEMLSSTVFCFTPAASMSSRWSAANNVALGSAGGRAA